MTSAHAAPAAATKPPITMFGPDFPFAYDDWVKHPAGLGKVPAERHGTEVAIIGAGIAGLLTAFELMKLGLKPVVYEAGRLGGRLRSMPFEGAEGVIAELGAMRFPGLLHHLLPLSRHGRAGDQAVSQSAVAGHALHRHRSRGRADLRGEAGGPAAHLQGGGGGLERGAGAWRAVLRHAGRHAPPRRGQGQGDLELPDPDLGRAQLLRLRRHRPMPSPAAAIATARSSARWASAPAAGTPISPTPCWRSCGSSIPTRTATSAWWWAASSSCRAGCGRWRRIMPVHWPIGHLARCAPWRRPAAGRRPHRPRRR